MKKYLIIFLCVLILPLVSAVSLSSAQNTAKEYLLTNEFLDSSFYYISCDSNSYYVLGVIDNKENFSFFIPIEEKEGLFVYSKTEKTKNILKTAYLLKSIKTKSSSSNYLSSQLLEKIDTQNTILNSKLAKLDGLIKANYSNSITQKLKNTKTKLEALIDSLETIQSNLSKLQRSQSEFLDSSDCKNVDSLLYSYKSSFSDYDKLISKTLSYKDSINEIIEVVVADKDLEEATKRMILSYTEAPTTISSEISNIFDWVSSTNVFYQDIVYDFERTGPNSVIELLTTKINARKEYHDAKTALYGYDSDLKNTLNSTITTILSENNIAYWKESKTVTELSENYSQILDLYNKGKYPEALTKIELAKRQAKRIIAEGFIEYEEEQNYTYFIFAGSALLLLLLIIFLFKKFSKPIKSKSSKKKESSDITNLFNKRDPFK